MGRTQPFDITDSRVRAQRGVLHSATVSTGFALRAAVVCAFGITAWAPQATAGVQTAENTRIQTYDAVVFETRDQSIWDPSTASLGTVGVDWELTESQWKKFIGRPVTARVGVGRVIEECVLGVCGKAGVAAGLKAETYFLPYFNAELQPGTFDASVAYQPKVIYQASGLGTDFTSLKTDSGLRDNPANKLVVRAPSIKLDTGLNIKTELSLFAEACAVGCALDETFPIPDLSTKFKLPVLQINTKIDPVTGKLPTVKILNPPTNGFEAKQELIQVVGKIASGADFSEVADSLLYDDFSELMWEKARDRLAQFDPKVKEAKTPEAKTKAINDGKQAITTKRNILNATSPVVGGFSNPYLDDAEGELADGKLTASIGGELASISLDVDRILGTALGLPNGGSLSLAQLGVPTSALSAEITLGDVKIGPVFEVHTNVTVEPELMVHLEFDAPVLIKGKIGKQNSYTGRWDDLPEIALLAPEGELKFDAKQDSIGTVFNDSASAVSAKPTFFVESTVTNETFLDVKAKAEIELFSAEISIPAFGSKSIPPVFKETRETGTLAKVDLYKNSFEVNDWAESEEGKARYTPTEASYVVEADSGKPATSNDGSLSFSAAGEVVFQARRKFGASETPERAQDDPRVNENLSTAGLVQDIAEIQPYGANVFGDSGLAPGDPYAQFFPFVSAYDLTQPNVRRALQQRLQVESGQTAHVMRDGRLVVNNAFTVEAGGTLELGLDPKIVSGFLNKDKGVFIFSGSQMTVHGTVYSGSSESEAIYANSGSLSDAHAFVNSGRLEIGQTGTVKADGAFVNDGRTVNRGALELTTNDAESRGTFYNGYGAELDVFGSLSAAQADNLGTITTHTGASLLLSNSGNSAGSGKLTNFGELAVERGALMRLESGAGGNFELQNRFLLENQGLLEIKAGAVLFNGFEGTDYQSALQVADVAGAARQTRNAALAPLAGQLAQDNAEVLRGVVDAERKRQQFISAANESISGLRARAVPFAATQRAAIETLKTLVAKRDAVQAEFDDESCGNSGVKFECIFLTSKLINAKNAVEDQEAFVSGFAATAELAVELDKLSGAIGGTFTQARNTEATYDDAIEALEARRGVVGARVAQIEGAILAQAASSGFGLLKNEEGGLLVNESALVNFSVLENDFGGAVYNDGFLANAGLFRNDGELVNQSGALLGGNGVLFNGREEVGSAGLSNVVNLGSLENNTGILANHDTLDNFGTLRNSNGLLYNTGNLGNFGEVRNDGLAVNESGAGLNNHGLLVNNSSLTNRGVFNNGRRADLADGETALTVTEFVQLANTVYTQRQARAEAGVLLPRLNEELADVSARAGLLGENESIGVWRICFNAPPGTPGCLTDFSIIDRVNEQRDAARAFYEARQDELRTEIAATEAVLSQAIAALDPSLLDSASVAKLVNNGLFENSGLVNNVGTIVNNAGAELRNSGIVMVAESAKIDNQGDLMLVRDASLGQDGMLFSNGDLANGGLVEISAGTLINGTLASGVASLTNEGIVRLAGFGEAVRDPVSGEVTELRVRNASLINHDTLLNQAGGVLEIGPDDPQLRADGLLGVNTLANHGQLTNADGATLTNRGVLFNTGTIDNQAGSTFTSIGEIQNAKSGHVQFADSARLDGRVVNDGVVSMADNAVLTLTGDISGSGTFAGNTVIRGSGPGELQASVNPGNSPGLLTFDGNLTSAENVNWVMEIWGDERGIGYDGVDVAGDFTLEAEMSLTVLSILSFDAVLGTDFTFFSIAGDLRDEFGNAYADTFSFTGMSDFSEGWIGTWLHSGKGLGWNLIVSFEAGNNAAAGFASYSDTIAQYSATAVQRAGLSAPNASAPAPATVQILLLGLVLLGWSRRKSFGASRR